MFLTVSLICTFFSLVATYLWTIHSSYDYFKRRGIPGPPHRFFFGHYLELWSAKSFSKQLQQWTRQYGSIYGLFAGTRPTYVVSNVEFLEEVYIKQFSSFHSHAFARIYRGQNDEKVSLITAEGARWKRQRHVINPTFSSAKLKLMSSLVNECLEAMFNKLTEISCDKNTEINIYELYKRLTMDTICN